MPEARLNPHGPFGPEDLKFEEIQSAEDRTKQKRALAIPPKYMVSACVRPLGLRPIELVCSS